MSDISPIGRTHTEAVAERMKNPEYREEYERIKKRRELRELLDRSSVGGRFFPLDLFWYEN